MLPADLDVLAPKAYFVVRQPMLVFRSDRIQKHLVRLQKSDFFASRLNRLRWLLIYRIYLLF